MTGSEGISSESQALSSKSVQRLFACSGTLLDAIIEGCLLAELTACQIRKCLINNIKPKGLAKNSVIEAFVA